MNNPCESVKVSDMEHSDSIAEIATALSKAQGTMTGAPKDSANPFYKSRYADLESVWSACRKALSDNGLAVVQTVGWKEQRAVVTTMLTHSSGEWIRDTLSLQPKDDSPQGIGSCITYGRRYALAAIVGVYQTDDDAEAAHGRIDPRGEGHKSQDMKAAKEMAERFREAMSVGIDDRVLELHQECNGVPDFYIAVSTCLSAPERRSIKEMIHRAQQEQRSNGRA